MAARQPVKPPAPAKPAVSARPAPPPPPPRPAPIPRAAPAPPPPPPPPPPPAPRPAPPAPRPAPAPRAPAPPPPPPRAAQPVRTAPAPAPKPAAAPAPAPKPSASPVRAVRPASQTPPTIGGKGLSIYPAMSNNAANNGAVARQNAILKRQLDEANKKIKEMSTPQGEPIPAYNYPNTATEAPKQLVSDSRTNTSDEISKLLASLYEANQNQQAALPSLQIGANTAPAVSAPMAPDTQSYQQASSVPDNYQSALNMSAGQNASSLNEGLQITQGTKLLGGATGFSRKQSSARRSGTIGQGTSRLTIKREGTGTGLNLGF